MAVTAGRWHDIFDEKETTKLDAMRLRRIRSRKQKLCKKRPAAAQDIEGKSGDEPNDVSEGQLPKEVPSKSEKYLIKEKKNRNQLLLILCPI